MDLTKAGCKGQNFPAFAGNKVRRGCVLYTAAPFGARIPQQEAYVL